MLIIACIYKYACLKSNLFRPLSRYVVKHNPAYFYYKNYMTSLKSEISRRYIDSDKFSLLY